MNIRSAVPIRDVKVRPTLKGRTSDPKALAEVRALLEKEITALRADPPCVLPSMSYGGGQVLDARAAADRE